MANKYSFDIGTPHAIGLGAGLASALLFCLAGQGTFASMMLAYLSPLPLMIATLGFGVSTGLVAVVTGALCVTSLVGLASIAPSDLKEAAELSRQTLAGAAKTGLIYLISLGVPAFCLGLLGQSGKSASSVSPAPNGSPAKSWLAFGGPSRPLAGILTFALFASCLLVTAGSLWIWARQGGFKATLDKTVAEILPLIMQLNTNGLHWPASLTESDIARMIVLAVGPAMAASTLLMFLLNLWLAGRVVQVSGRLPRAWPDIPRSFRLPWIFVPVFIGACAVSVLGGPAGFIGLIFSVTTGLGFALQGLAAIHDLTRGTSFRVPLLIIVYLVFVLLMPWPLTLFGLADAIFPLGKRREALSIGKASSVKTNP
ncbi:DUF2232 domain-containing protein [Beijerinckia indica]|uniref:DUF2232 domain-containing protein n=1 Tax=Beijerinckia indica subsp. indica (strain ATCC 9039 / DSM 1715 / NCIMB 8712) TaxID=395963 RepID=B2IHD3_BEII9|nr:DUF2232 domain-containing protein [Beijerinckia indica]ACB95918.1 conserved hypothetical protein [Beijerinckia indica subsp. indica ATCC 9039]